MGAYVSETKMDGAFIVAVASLFSQGFVGMTLWRWFVAPLGFPHINYWWALGLITTIGLVRALPKESPTLKECTERLMAVWLILGIGWCFKAGMP